MLELHRAKHVEIQLQTVDLSIIARKISTDLQASEPERSLEVRSGDRRIDNCYGLLLDSQERFGQNLPPIKVQPFSFFSSLCPP